MIRLIALACGLLCGAGLMLSGLYDPTLVHEVAEREHGPLAYGIALFSIVFVASCLVPLTGRAQRPIMASAADPLPDWSTRKALVATLVFGLGWGLAGYVPLTAFVSAGALAPGAVVFLTAALFGMILVDVLSGARGVGRRRGSFG